MEKKRPADEDGSGSKHTCNFKRHKNSRTPGPGIVVTSLTPQKGPRAGKEVAEAVNNIAQKSTADSVEKKANVADSLQAEIEALNEDYNTAPFRFYGEEPARGVVFVRRTASGGLCPSAVITKLRQKDVNFRCAVRLTPIDFACSAHVPNFEKLVAEHLPEALKAFPGLKEWNVQVKQRNMGTITLQQANDCIKTHMPEGMFLSVTDPDIIVAVEINPLFAGFSIVEAPVASNEFNFR